MSGLTQLLYTGLTGLTAASEALDTVSNNTANVNTPGYNTQSVQQVELPGIVGGPGTGTDVTSIQRTFDQFLYQQGVEAASANQAAQVVETNAQNLAVLFPIASGGQGGLGAALNSFFSAANTVAQDPANGAQRQALLGQAQSLTANFRNVGAQISANLTNIGNEAGAAAQQVNTLTQQIAQLNQAISEQWNSLAGPPNSLLDQRDQLVEQLGQQLGVTILPGANGIENVYTSGGAALVNGTAAYQLTVGQSQYGDGSIAITYAATGQDLTAGISQGQLGGLLSARGQLISAQDSVGALAAGLAAAVNTQQSLGLDLNGNLGKPLFSVGGPVVYASQLNAGTGSLTAAITSPAQFVPGDFIVSKTGSGFQAANTTTGQVTPLGSGPTLSFNGLTITVSGTVATGDSFKVEPTAAAAQTLTTVLNDPSTIAAASAYVLTPGNNTGNVQATVGTPIASSALPTGAIQLPASQFGQKLTILFTSSTNFNILSSTNSVIASGTISPTAGADIAIAYPAPPAPTGEVAQILLAAGTAGTRDSFTLSPGGPGSNGNIVALTGLANQNVLSGQTLGTSYGTLVAAVGSRSQEAQAAAQATQAVLTQTQKAQQSVSGVNLDQQAAELVNYQQAYQAAAKVIATAQTLFQSLLAAV